MFLPNPWAGQKLDYPTHISSVPTPGINNERSLIWSLSEEQAPFTSEIVGEVSLRTHAVKRVDSQGSAESLRVLRGFLPQGWKVDRVG
jgi:hypothetical protein